MTIASRGVFILMLIAGSVGLKGCADSDLPERLRATGTVNVNGVPLEDGSIAFLPVAETIGPSVGGKIAKGRFNIAPESGPVEGDYRVEIRAYRSTGKQVPENSEEDAPEQLVDQIEQYLPPQYNEKSTLIAKVDRSTSRQLEFKLELR